MMGFIAQEKVTNNKDLVIITPRINLKKNKVQLPKEDYFKNNLILLLLGEVFIPLITH